MTLPVADWTVDPELWPARVEGYAHVRAIENSARKHGRALGNDFLVLLAKRLRKVDVVDGAVLDASTAWARVERWAREGRAS